MKLEDQVCSLDLAKKLKELGVEQESYFYFWRDAVAAHAGLPESFYLSHDGENPPDYPAFSAFTVAELGEMLPNYSSTRRPRCRLKKHDPEVFGNFHHHSWECAVNTLDKQYAHTEADARAKMLIYLIENGLIPALSKGRLIQHKLIHG